MGNQFLNIGKAALSAAFSERSPRWCVPVGVIDILLEGDYDEAMKELSVIMD